MDDVKTFPATAALSLWTGRLAGDFSDMHALCEHLSGGPIFTHMFAHQPLWDDLKRRLAAQVPNLPTDWPPDVPGFLLWVPAAAAALGDVTLTAGVEDVDGKSAAFRGPLAGKAVTVVSP